MFVYIYFFPEQPKDTDTFGFNENIFFNNHSLVICIENKKIENEINKKSSTKSIAIVVVFYQYTFIIHGFPFYNQSRMKKNSESGAIKL